MRKRVFSSLVLSAAMTTALLALSSCDNSEEVNFSAEKYSTAVTSDAFVTQYNAKYDEFTAKNDALATGFTYKEEKIQKDEDDSESDTTEVSCDVKNYILSEKETQYYTINSSSEKGFVRECLNTYYVVQGTDMYMADTFTYTYSIRDYDSESDAKDGLTNIAQTYSVNNYTKMNAATILLLSLTNPLYYVDGNVFSIVSISEDETKKDTTVYQFVFGFDSYTSYEIHETFYKDENYTKKNNAKKNITVKSQKLSCDLTKYCNDGDVPSVGGGI